ncbi:MAG: hypothetical protein KYX62_00985 [Pseudomonadota bacterium]|nr:hypothetical protein [Pseudomonadota bacterium]
MSRLSALLVITAILLLNGCSRQAAENSSDADSNGSDLPHETGEVTDPAGGLQENSGSGNDSGQYSDEERQQSDAAAAERERRLQEQERLLQERVQKETDWSEQIAAEEAAAAAAEDALMLLPDGDDSGRTPASEVYSDESQGISAPPFSEYRAVLTADEHLLLPGSAGEMRVWIGNPDYQPQTPAGMVADSASIPAAGDYAIIEPQATGFTVTPVISECLRIHPAGSEQSFTLQPQETGRFYISARIYLYDNAHCSGSPVPRTTTRLSVVVEVNGKKIVTGGLTELATIFWQKLVEFWEIAVGLLFGLILFLLRRQLRRRFGYQQDDD